jgi:hypothetical protein
LCPACPECPLWSGDRLGVLDTILDRAGRKGLLGRVVGNKILTDARQISLGDVLGDAAGDAFRIQITSF